MDHMRIPDTEPSSVILSHIKYFQQVERDVPKRNFPEVSKQAEAKEMV